MTDKVKDFIKIFKELFVNTNKGLGSILIKKLLGIKHSNSRRVCVCVCVCEHIKEITYFVIQLMYKKWLERKDILISYICVINLI